MRLDASDFAAAAAAAAAIEISEARDQAIKLFGRTIPLPENQTPPLPPAAAKDGETSGEPLEMETEGGQQVICQDTASTEVMESTSFPQELDQVELNSSACLNNSSEDDQQTSFSDHKIVSEPNPEQDQPEADTSGQDKVLKKPDKILPCPRCNSLDTKFCYYNNYNVNQPRHFCKNCQRYWTAGGTMRNVPVGAGRRKNKHSSTQYRQIMMPSDGMTSGRIDAPEPHPSGPGSTGVLKGNGTVLKVGAEAPLCDSMASVLNLQELRRNDDVSSVASAENKEELSCASSPTASNCMENEQPENPVQLEPNSIQGYQNGVAPMHHIQCYHGPPWAYPWGPGWNNAAAVLAGQCSEIAYGSDNSNGSPIPWNAPQFVAAPAFCAPAIPVPFMPASFWGFMPGWNGGSWNLPIVGTNGGLSPSSSISTSVCSSNSSPILGKHSRDTSSLVDEKVKKSLWAPKTLRIDDPEEAAKSSIWDTLGIKPDEGVILKAFRSKTERKGHISDSARALHANPAAFSRSQSFQESM